MRVSKLAAVAACVAGALGCDPSVTSVGAWEPVVVVPPASVYFEAESGELSGGYVVTTSAAASGGQIIEPPLVENADTVVGDALARYTFEVPRDGDYVIWGRLSTPDVAHNRAWFRVDDGEWTLWRITVGKTWYWDDLTDHRGRLLVPHQALLLQCSRIRSRPRKSRARIHDGAVQTRADHRG